MASTSTTTTTSSPNPNLVSANFATPLNPKPTIDYDHEIYLQLTASADRPAKTANQVYREVRFPFLS